MSMAVLFLQSVTAGGSTTEAQRGCSQASLHLYGSKHELYLYAIYIFDHVMQPYSKPLLNMMLLLASV